MGKYLDLANSIPRTEVAPQGANLENLEKLDSPEVCRLLKAGWKPETSFGGKVIWKRPDNGFYRSEKAAICLLDLMENTDRPETLNCINWKSSCLNSAFPNDFDKRG